MTVRPRYTARMKARDIATAYGIAWRGLAPILARVAALVVGGTRRTITARYTDPRP